MNKSYETWWLSLDYYWKLKIVQGPFNNWTDKQKVILKNKYNNLEIENIVLNIEKLTFFDKDEKMTNVPDLSPLQNLLEFHIGNKCKFENIDNIKTCRNIEYLSIFNSEIDNIEFVSFLHNLKRLELFTTKVSNFDCLMNLVNLEYLAFTKHFSDTEIRVTDLSPITDLTNLKVLHVSQDIKNLEPVSKLINLEEFSYRQIESFEYLRNLKNLKKIFVMFDNKSTVSDLSPLSELSKLEHLDISFSKITNLIPIYNLKNLKLFVYKDTPLDEEYKNFWKRLFGKTEIQKFKKINPNCELKNYK